MMIWASVSLIEEFGYQVTFVSRFLQFRTL
ncbi:hypothetical protein ACB092_05G107500 [Castanea dentata]